MDRSSFIPILAPIMSAGIALLEELNGHVFFPSTVCDPISNVTFTEYSDHPSIFLNQCFGMINSFCGFFCLVYVYFGEPKVFERKSSLKVLLNALLVTSIIMALFEVGVQANYFIMLIYAKNYDLWTMVPRILPISYIFLNDLRFWIMCTAVGERILLRYHPTYIIYGRPLGCIFLIPSVLVPLLMMGFVLIANGLTYYGEYVNLNIFFIFSPTSRYTWNYIQKIWDAVMIAGFGLSTATIISPKVKNRLAIYDHDYCYYKMACITFLYVIFFASDRVYQILMPYLSDNYLITQTFACCQSITNNLYTLLLSIQLICLNRSYRPQPEPTEVRPEPVTEIEMETYIRPQPRDPLLEEWNRAYNRYMEDKLRYRQYISTRV